MKTNILPFGAVHFIALAVLGKEKNTKERATWWPMKTEAAFLSRHTSERARMIGTGEP